MRERRIYGSVRSLPLSAHTQAAWFVQNQPFLGLQIASLRLQLHETLQEWNYTIKLNRRVILASFLKSSQCRYLTEHPYGREVGMLTGLPAIASSRACET